MAAARPRLFPREHGAYAVLMASWLCGVAVGRTVSVESMLMLAFALLLFIAQEPIKHLVRALARNSPFDMHDVARTRVLLGASIMGFAVLAIDTPRLFLITPVVFVLSLAAYATQRRRAPLFVQSIVGFTILTLAGPAAYLVSPHVSIGSAAILWFELLVFFWAASLLVNLKLAPQTRVACLIYYLCALPIASVAFSQGFYSLAGLAALGLSPFDSSGSHIISTHFSNSL
jgi:hypothetical protein